VPDEIATEAAKEILKADPVLGGLIVLLVLALWWVDRRATNERKENQAALNAATAAHLSDVKRANDQFDPIKDQMAALVSQNHTIIELVRERRK
jgi:hypothetical protein